MWWFICCGVTTVPAGKSHIHDIAPLPLPFHLEVFHVLGFLVSILGPVLLDGIQSTLVLTSIRTELPTNAGVAFLALLHELEFGEMRIVHAYVVTSDPLEHSKRVKRHTWECRSVETS